MEDQLVTKETAILAKEKGFDEVTDVFFNSSYPWPGEENINALRHSDGNDFTSVPTQSLLQRWFREKHNIHVFIGWRPNVKKWDGHAYSLSKTVAEYVKTRTLYRFRTEPLYDKYEEALEAGLIEALNLIP